MSASHRTMNLFENPSYFRLTGRGDGVSKWVNPTSKLVNQIDRVRPVTGDVKSVKNLTLLISPLLLLLVTLLLGALTSPLLGNCYGAN